MNTTTQHAAEPTPAPQQEAAKPTPAYAFSTYVESQPAFQKALQEIADLTDSSICDLKQPNGDFSWALVKLDSLPKPDPLPEIAFIQRQAQPLVDKFKNPDLTDEERKEIQKKILKIKDAPFQPIRDHQEKVERLQKLAAEAVTGFEEWITADPAGIAAAAQDKAHSEWVEAEEARIRAEAIEAEKQARIEKARAERKQEAIQLWNEIGIALFDTDTDHPDIDGKTFQAFMKWVPENEDRVNYFGPDPINAILVGPPGVGKSRALAAAAVADCEKQGRENIEWVTGYEFAELVSNLSTDKRTEANARLEVITDAWHLYFDDLGSANFTAARTARFFRLIDERYRRNRITFFSTNHTPQQLRKIFTSSSESKDEAVRILRRICGTQSHPLAQLFQFKKPATK
jgi:DNA replication protein DnaC